VPWGGPKWSAVYRYNCTCIGVTGGPGGLASLEIWPQGQEPSGAIWALPMWAPGQIEGMRVGGLAQRKRLSRIASERQLQPGVRRKARQELWSVMPSRCGCGCVLLPTTKEVASVSGKLAVCAKCMKGSKVWRVETVFFARSIVWGARGVRQKPRQGGTRANTECEWCGEAVRMGENG
jgi:hypothetical protein